MVPFLLQLPLSGDTERKAKKDAAGTARHLAAPVQEKSALDPCLRRTIRRGHAPRTYNTSYPTRTRCTHTAPGDTHAHTHYTCTHTRAHLSICGRAWNIVATMGGAPDTLLTAPAYRLRTPPAICSANWEGRSPTAFRQEEKLLHVRTRFEEHLLCKR